MGAILIEERIMGEIAIIHKDQVQAIQTPNIRLVNIESEFNNFLSCARFYCLKFSKR
jgi:hypothetical protein